jgi:hypothetical protein
MKGCILSTPNYDNVVSFGASITAGYCLKDQKNNWAQVIAQTLNTNHVNQAYGGAANGGISRLICSYSDYKKDLVLVMWTSPTRYEFRTQDSWQEINGMMDPTEFSRAWYKGPGLYQYTEITTTVKEILLAQYFLQSRGLDYLFVFDNDDIAQCWLALNPDTYIGNLLNLIDQSKILWFDDTGFIQWSQKNNFEFVDNHPVDQAHVGAANYILASRFLTASDTNKFPNSL